MIQVGYHPHLMKSSMKMKRSLQRKMKSQRVECTGYGDLRM